jgi:hypothetical protein
VLSVRTAARPAAVLVIAKSGQGGSGQQTVSVSGHVTGNAYSDACTPEIKSALVLLSDQMKRRTGTPSGPTTAWPGDLHSSIKRLNVTEENANYFTNHFGRSEEGALITVAVTDREAEAEAIREVLRRYWPRCCWF